MARKKSPGASLQSARVKVEKEDDLKPTQSPSQLRRCPSLPQPPPSVIKQEQKEIEEEEEEEPMEEEYEEESVPVPSSLPLVKEEQNEIEEEEEEEPMEEEEVEEEEDVEEEEVVEEEEDEVEVEEEEEVEVEVEEEEEEEEPMEDEEEQPVEEEEEESVEEEEEEEPMEEEEEEPMEEEEVENTIKEATVENVESKGNLISLPSVEPIPAASTAKNTEEKGNMVSLPFLTDMTSMISSEKNFMKSIDELQGLSAALSVFLGKYAEIEKHFEFIRKAIESTSKISMGEKAIHPTSNICMEKKAIDSTEKCSMVEKALASVPATKIPVQEKAISSPSNIPVENKEKEKVTPVAVTIETCKTQEGLAPVCSRQQEKPAAISVTLEGLCNGTTGGRALRKYILCHLDDIAKLRKEVPIALRHGTNPPKLVINCIGHFYQQGIKAYTKEPPMIFVRRASVLLLEFLLLAESFNTDPTIKREAEDSAITWKKRIINEGGLSTAHIEDAKGLLFFVAAYGIPSSFSLEDLVEFFLVINLRMADLSEIANALRRSPFLMEKIPAIICELVKKGMTFFAVDAIRSFGVEDKLPPEAILKPFFHKSEVAWTEARNKLHNLPAALKEANQKHIADLKSAVKCLRDCNIEPRKLDGWDSDKIDAKIAKLEKENLDLEEKAISKRKAKVLEKRTNQETSNQQTAKQETTNQETANQDMKRPRPSSGTGKLMLHSQSLPVRPANGNSFHDGRFSSPVNAYPGVSPVNAAGQSAGRGLRNGGFGQLPNHGAAPFMWHGNGAPNVNSMGYNPMRPMVPMGIDSFRPAQPMNPYFPGQLIVSPGVGTQPMNPRPAPPMNPYFPGQPHVIPGVGIQPMNPYFPGQPNASLGVGSRGSGSNSDLYNFADIV